MGYYKNIFLAGDTSMKHKPKKVLIAFLFFLTTLLFWGTETLATEPSDTLWTKTFGGTNIDVGYSVQQTSDGGYIIAGDTRSYGTISGHNIWLVKTDLLGNQEWNNTFGGNSDEEAYSVMQTSDGGYILCGYSKSFGAGVNDVILIKTNSAGTLEWQKFFGGSSDEEGYSVIQTPDKGYIIGCATTSFGAGSRDGWLIKTDSLGNDQWKKTYGGMSSDGIRCVRRTLDGGYILTGWTFSTGASSVGSLWLLKVNSQGIEEWNKMFTGSNADRGYYVQQTTDSGYIVTGYTSSYGAGLDDMLLIKTDPLGNAEWKKYFGGTGRDYGNEVQITSDGGFIVAGYTLSSGAGGDDIWLVKTDGAGILQWSKTYGGTASEKGYSVKQTSDGGYVITGHTLSYGAGVHDVWLIKTVSSVPVELTSFTGENFDGKVLLSWSTASESNNKGFEVEKLEDISLPDSWETIGFVEGNRTTTLNHQYSFIDKNTLQGVYKYRLKQIDFDGAFQYSDVIEVAAALPDKYIVKQNYPNPFNPSTTIEYSLPQTSFVSIKIYDVLGKELEVLSKEIKPAGQFRVNWNAHRYSGGVYFYEVRSGSFTKTGKMILMK